MLRLRLKDKINFDKISAYGFTNFLKNVRIMYYMSICVLKQRGSGRDQSIFQICATVFFTKLTSLTSVNFKR